MDPGRHLPLLHLQGVLGDQSSVLSNAGRVHDTMMVSGTTNTHHESHSVYYSGITVRAEAERTCVRASFRDNPQPNSQNAERDKALGRSKAKTSRTTLIALLGYTPSTHSVLADDPTSDKGREPSSRVGIPPNKSDDPISIHVYEPGYNPSYIVPSSDNETRQGYSVTSSSEADISSPRGALIAIEGLVGDAVNESQTSHPELEPNRPPGTLPTGPQSSRSHHWSSRLRAIWRRIRREKR
ncbi:hypothetical protein VNI00_012144 [Paramarasmius palmivorus]|uniref:Uncharacterized protein n=1 Tax=Paramarasmius palmivorus TaxID=297713 RepID=A0AAW0C6V9_9AGAR